MISFNSKQRFQVLNNGLIYASAGVQTNCAGIAAILVKIEKQSKKLIFINEKNYNCGIILNNIDCETEDKLNNLYANAVFEGVKQTVFALEYNHGFTYTLVEALIYPVDANQSRFREAGSRSIIGWLEIQNQ